MVGASHTRRIICGATRAESGTGPTRSPASRASSSATAGCCSHAAGSSRGAATGTCRAASSNETESPLDGLRREFREETGLDVEPVELFRIDIEPYGERYVFSVTWIVRGEGEPVAADDVDELRWFARDELPAEMAFPGQELVLRSWATREEHA